MSWVEDWTVVAACRGMDPDELFVQGAAQNRAKTVCSGCPVRTECLADALDNRVEYGVWGGMTERERRALLRRRPEVRSWRQFLEAAKENYERNGAERTGGDLNAAEVDERFAAATQAAIPRQRSEAGSFGRA
jgi:WhiB family redox-sensing transcriptional regulator